MATREKTTLTDAVATNVLPGEKRTFLWDKKLAGFGLRIEPSGVRSWIVKYRAQGGGRSAPVRWLTVGPYPTIRAKDARDHAAKALASVRLGSDPAGDLVSKRREMTMAQLVDLYIKDGLIVLKGVRRGEPMRPETAAYTTARLRNHVIPLLGKRRVSEITPGDIVKFVKDVAAGKSAKNEKLGHRRRSIVRGGDGAARKVVRDVSVLFTFAMQHRIVTENPVATAAVRKIDNKRERYLSLSEMERLGAALMELEAEGMKAKAADIIRLWAITGCRRNEICALKWSEVDLARGLLVLEESKTGRSVRPLGSAAAALLTELRQKAGEDAIYVFPAESGDSFFQGMESIWPRVIMRAGLPGISPHTLRHSVGSNAASQGEPLLLIGAILGHANPRSTAIYAHVDYDPARKAAGRATGAIAAALARGSLPPMWQKPVDASAIAAAVTEGRISAELLRALSEAIQGTPAQTRESAADIF